MSKELKILQGKLDSIKLKHEEFKKYNSHLVSFDRISKISKINYELISEGIYDRVIQNSTDIKFPTEFAFFNELKEIDFNRYLVVSCKMFRNGQFMLHHHDVNEIIICISGAYIGAGDKIFKKGDRQYIKAYQPHLFKCIEAGYCLILLEKPYNE